MSQSRASALTWVASRQTYFTIRFLVDRPRVEDAYRAYAYFRWVDDILDADIPSGSIPGDESAFDRKSFLDRQQALLDRCLRGDPLPDANRYESMLVELVRHADPADGGLETYLRQMMLVMDFDVRRRGSLISQADLDAYTRSLSIAVTEAMHHFIGHDAYAPHDETRYLAVSAAHVLHMLRDTYADIRAGYFNVPREVLTAHSIGPTDVHSDGYRAWVQDRVELARVYIGAGRDYFERVGSWRHRLAGLAYLARFAWLIEALERDDFAVRPEYSESKRVGMLWRSAWPVISSSFPSQGRHAPPRPVPSARQLHS